MSYTFSMVKRPNVYSFSGYLTEFNYLMLHAVFVGHSVCFLFASLFALLRSASGKSEKYMKVEAAGLCRRI